MQAWENLMEFAGSKTKTNQPRRPRGARRGTRRIHSRE